jgi:MoxR-like ATPase
MLQPQEVRDSVSRITSTFKALEKAVVGRQRVLRQIMYALITKNHVLLEGPPGVAKSYMANKLFSAIKDARHFKVQCTKKMTEDYIVGPLDMHLFREEGEYMHRVEGYMPCSHYAFLDEFLDLSTGALRALLEILNERTFSRGPQSVKCPLVSAVCATNFSGDTDVALEAVLDRFMFKAKVGNLTRPKDRMAMFQADDVDVPVMYNQDILRVNSALQHVKVPQLVLEVYLKMCEPLKLTDRTVRRAIDIVKASAVLRGRGIAMVEDLTELELCFVTTGNSVSEQEFCKAAQAYKAGLAVVEAAANINVIRARVSGLFTLMKAATSYKEAEPIAIEVREAMGALLYMRTPETQSMTDQSSTVCEAILNMADAIYHKENSK